MAHSKAQQRSSYPLAAYNFRVNVDGAAMRFAKVSGLQREYKTVTYRHGLSFIEGEQITKYFVDTYVPVTLTQGTVIGAKSLHEWLERSKPVALEVHLCDAEGTPVLAWRIAKALPVKLTAPTFDAGTNEVAIDTLELRAAGITIVHLA
jgi:phage tail-like protein